MFDDAVVCGNLLLQAMPEDVRESWWPHLQDEHMGLGEEFGQNDLLGGPFVYFPTTALVSLVHVMASGASAEVAVVGNDGAVGMAMLMGGVASRGLSSVHGVVQSGGDAVRMPLALVRTTLERNPVVLDVFLRYMQDLISQMAQTAACNRHHQIEQQLCRWLLLSLDRVGGRELTMTQELISNMLGVRREGITTAAASLQRKNIIRYARGHITVLDRLGLERCACECYASLKHQLQSP